MCVGQTEHAAGIGRRLIPPSEPRSHTWLGATETVQRPGGLDYSCVNRQMLKRPRDKCVGAVTWRHEKCAKRTPFPEAVAPRHRSSRVENRRTLETRLVERGTRGNTTTTQALLGCDVHLLFHWCLCMGLCLCLCMG